MLKRYAESYQNLYSCPTRFGSMDRASDRALERGRIVISDDFPPGQSLFLFDSAGQTADVHHGIFVRLLEMAASDFA